MRQWLEGGGAHGLSPARRPGRTGVRRGLRVAQQGALGVLLACSLPVMAQDLTLSLQGNYTPERDPDLRGSVAMEFAFNPYAREADGSSHTLDLRLFARAAEGADAQRQHADVREFQYLRAWGPYELRFGIGRVYWGVTESAQLVDILNQSDLLEDVDGEDKLGQPLMGFGRRVGPGRLTGFLLPHFREREFGPVFNELAPAPIVESEARFQNRRGRQHLDLALRYALRLGPLDIGLSHFRGNAREPRLVPCAAQGSGRVGTEQQANCNIDEAFAPPSVGPLAGLLVDTAALLRVGPSRDELAQEFIDAALADVVLVPFYDDLMQWGLDAQWIAGPAVWKWEARYREQNAVSQFAAVAGVEYSLGTFVNNLLDVGVLVEYLYDDRDVEEYFALFDNDVFLGIRLLGNDVAGTQVLGGVIYDVERGDQFVSVEASRRLGSRLRLAAEVRGYKPGEQGAITDFLDDIDQLRLEISAFF